MTGEQRVSGSFSDSITATGHFRRRVQADYDAVSDKMLPERSRNRQERGGTGKKEALPISRGHSELKVNVPERSPQSEAHCPVRLGRARDRGAGHREGSWGLKSFIQPSEQRCRDGPESGTTTPSRECASVLPTAPHQKNWSKTAPLNPGFLFTPSNYLI